MLYLQTLIYYYSFTHGHHTGTDRARTCTDIGLCVPRTHGRATDMPRTFPVARRIQDHALGCGHPRDIRDEVEPLRPLDLYYRCTSRRAGYRLVIRATLGLVAHNSSEAHSDVAGRSMSYEYRLYSTSSTSLSLTFTGDICVLHWQT